MTRFLLPLAALLFVTEVAEAQIWRRARDAARAGLERAVEGRAERAAEDAVNALFDAGEDVVRCLFTDDECVRRAGEAGEDVVLTDADGTPVDRDGRPVTERNAADAVVRADRSGAAAGGPSGRVGEGAWANYDFVPGARVLFADDFEDDRVGNVPGRLDFHSGVMEVVAEGGNQMLRFADASAVAVPLPETLPERFTIEFDVYSADSWNSVVLGTGPLDPAGADFGCFHGDLRGHSAAEFRVGSWFETGVSSETGGSSLQKQSAHEEALVPVRIAVDGDYVKMYVGEARVANVPNADVRRTDRVLLTACGELAAADDGSYGPVFLDNLRVAAGGREALYERIEAEGRVATRGVLFDTASARLRPESTPTLADIARMMERHAGLRLRVEGHTDAAGAADANRRLSQERAEAVVAWLVAQGVDAGRLEAVGLGQTAPAADNATPEGRQQNRRVELVRL